MPRWRGWLAFLAERVDGHHPVTSLLLANAFVSEVRFGDRLVGHSRYLLTRAVDARRLHAIDAVALDAFFQTPLPFELAIPTGFLREQVLAAEGIVSA